MSTNSTIAVQHSDKTISMIYCHWDGYVEYNGLMLKEHYTELPVVERLISFGDLSALRENIGDDQMDNHSFDNPKKDICIFYGRDRGETNISSRKYPSLLEYLLKAPQEEYNYIFIDGEWKIRDFHDGKTLQDFNPYHNL